MENQEEEQYIKITLKGEKITCQVQGTHGPLVNAIATLLIEEKSGLRHIVDDAVELVVEYELKQQGVKSTEELLQTVLSNIKPGEA